MTEVTAEYANELADMVKIRLSPGETEIVAAALAETDRHAALLTTRDRAELPPVWALGSRAATRPDEPRPGVDRDAALAHAPAAANGFFLVPETLE